MDVTTSHFLSKLTKVFMSELICSILKDHVTGEIMLKI